MAKCQPFKKVKPGESIPVTARQLESFMLEHNGKFNSRDYDKFERMHVIMDQLYQEFGHISEKYDFTSFIDDMSEYANKKMQGATVEKHGLLGQKTQKQRKIDDLAEKYAELDKESLKAVKGKLKKRHNRFAKDKSNYRRKNQAN